MERRFVTVDVFTDRPFGGNPLAVVLDGDGLDDAAMQTIAREFNLSETAFILPPGDPANTANVRIFTPGKELPFAGHPNVGTGYVLGREGNLFGKALGPRLLFEEKAGLVAVDVLSDGGAVTGARLTAPAAFAKVQDIDPALAAAALCLAPSDLDPAHGPLVASAGMDFPLVRLGSLEALAKAKPDAALITGDAALRGHVFLYVVTAPGELRARMFAPGMGIAEDPATGSAACAVSGLLAMAAGTDGTHAFRITQGVEMGRPSLMETAADLSGGAVTAIRLGGWCAPMLRGTLDA